MTSRGSKSNKTEGVPQAELKQLKTFIQYGEYLASILKENSNALIAQIDSQTLTVQKLHQDLNSQKDRLVVAEHQTPLPGQSNVTKDGNAGMISDKGRQIHKQQKTDVTPHGVSTWQNENSLRNFDVHNKGRQQDLKENADDPLKSLLHNNQTVLMTQAKAIQGAVETQIHWLQNLQSNIDSLLSPNSGSSSSEPDKRFFEKYRAIEADKIAFAKNCKDLEAEKKNLQKEIEQLQKTNDVLRQEKSDLKSKLAKFNLPSQGQYVPHRIQVRSQLYCPRKTDLTDSVITELTSMLKHKMDSSSLEFNMINCESTTQIIGSFPLIVICLYASHLGTDVLHALQGVTVGSNVAVLVLHHKDIHALPAQTSDRILTGDDCKDVGAIIDMAFLSQKGFYTCNMNDRGLEDLTNFIKTHSNQ